MRSLSVVRDPKKRENPVVTSTLRSQSAGQRGSRLCQGPDLPGFNVLRLTGRYQRPGLMRQPGESGLRVNVGDAPHVEEAHACDGGVENEKVVLSSDAGPAEISRQNDGGVRAPIGVAPHYGEVRPSPDVHEDCVAGGAVVNQEIALSGRAGSAKVARYDGRVAKAEPIAPHRINVRPTPDIEEAGIASGAVIN